jgi:hypothetical protein
VKVTHENINKAKLIEKERTEVNPKIGSKEWCCGRGVRLNVGDASVHCGRRVRLIGISGLSLIIAPIASIEQDACG